MSLQQNLNEIKNSIPAGVTLIAVSKSQPIGKIRELYDLGQRVFGENRAQEMTTKYESLPGNIQWHMIGHLQSNKIKYIASYVNFIHSVDSPKVLSEINRQAARFDRVIPCLLQVHIAEEETKFGFSPEEVTQFLRSGTWSEMAHVKVMGLMGMATFTKNEEQIRREFKSLRSLFDKLKQGPVPPAVQMTELSMGMTGDYKIAIEEGSTMVRVGTAIFGERAKKKQA